MANLTVDIGNTSAKAAVFEGGRVVGRIPSITSSELRKSSCSDLAQSGVANFEKAIVCSTRGGISEIEEIIRQRARFFMRFDYTTPIPIKNLYGTPETLGADRLAAAVGAHTIFPGETVLVVDFGTAITFDIVTAAGEYLGGNISPGAAIRFRALHEFTGSLPLLTLPGAAGQGSSRRVEGNIAGRDAFPGRDTREAIENGIVLGVIAETEHYIATACEKFGARRTIFTGGDSDYFAERVKFPIFASSDLVFQGLNAILEHNAKV